MENKLYQRIKEFVEDENLIQKGDRICVGFSGGPDSVFLVEFLLRYQKELDFDFFLAHVHHGYRKSADEDLAFCESYAKDRGLELVTCRVDMKEEAKKRGLGLEEAGRFLRYEFFDSQLKEGDKIALGHHADDQAETVLMRIIRGTGLDGLVGILPQDGNRIRPLLEVTKEEILESLDEMGLDYCIDETNFQTDQFRNRVRKNILPKMKKENPSIVEQFARMTKTLREENEILKKRDEELFKACVLAIFEGEIILSKRAMKHLTKGETKRLLRYCISKLRPLEGFTSAHIEEFLKIFWTEGRKSMSIYGIMVLSTKREIHIVSENRKKTALTTFTAEDGLMLSLPDGRLELSKIRFTEEYLKTKSNWEEVFPLDFIGKKISIRGYEAEDVMLPMGKEGFCRVVDLLKKNPPEFIRKKTTKVLVYEDELIWLVGIRRTQKHPVRLGDEALCIKWIFHGGDNE